MAHWAASLLQVLAVSRTHSKRSLKLPCPLSQHQLRHLVLSRDLGNDTPPLLALLPVFREFYIHDMYPLSSTRFSLPCFHLPGLRPRLETVNFLCLEAMELEPLINHVVMQNLQCKLRKCIHLLLYSVSAEPGRIFSVRAAAETASFYVFSPS